MSFSNNSHAHLHRLRIMRGQIDGIIRMIEKEESCDRIFPQIKAIKNAFSAFSLQAAKDFFSECREKKLSEKEISDLFAIIAA